MKWNRDGDVSWAQAGGHYLKVHKESFGWAAFVDGRIVAKGSRSGFDTQDEAERVALEAMAPPE